MPIISVAGLKMDSSRNVSVRGVLSSFADGASREALVRNQMARILEPSGEGARAFLKVYESAVDAAAAFDREAQQSRPLPRYAGVTVSIKDLFDVAGEVTTSGSVLLKDAAPAVRNAEPVARLKSAGFIPVGRTNMTEFAYSGLGINPHFGTPLNPYERVSRRIPGGSSSGGAVSVSDGMATVALGTDTGGSCRIPAALCGLVGFKPTASRILSTGTMPLSTSLDSIGSIGNSVECCAAVDQVLSGQPFSPSEIELSCLRVGVPSSYVFEDIDKLTALAFDHALHRISAAGAEIVTIDLAALADMPLVYAKGGLVAREAYLFHRSWIQEGHDKYDPRVLIRILNGEKQTDTEYREVQRVRRKLIAAADSATRDVDVVAMPTVPKIAPTLDELTTDDAYSRVNMLMLRNPTIANMLDRCAISIPCHDKGMVPVGFMLMGKHNQDQRLFEVAAAVEKALSTQI